MKELVVISGKGGTGKTSLVAAFAALAGDAVLADCDVDAADLHLILKPDVRHTEDFSGGRIARIVTDKCIGCGRCVEVCHFGAVAFDGPANGVVARTYRVDAIGCEGCGVCTHFCPAGAIEFAQAVNGRWFVSRTRFGSMVHARLAPGQENSGKLVTLIRRKARRIAEEEGKDLLLVDGSPGIGCPVIASITGADFVLVVTEPTLPGRHDLRRVLDLAGHFDVPAAVCINKWDINPDLTDAIEADILQEGSVPAGRISYDPAVTHAQVAEKTITEYAPDGLGAQLAAVWETVTELLKTTK